MLKKWVNKYTIIMFIAGAILFNAPAISAEVTEAVYPFTDSPYKLIVDGEEYSYPNLEHIFYFNKTEGNNYASIKVIQDLCIKIGVDFDNDTETKIITINTNKENNTLPEKAANSQTLTVSGSAITTKGAINSDMPDYITNKDKTPKVSTITLDNGQNTELKIFSQLKSDIKDLSSLTNVNCIYYNNEIYVKTNHFTKYFKALEDRYEWNVKGIVVTLYKDGTTNNSFIYYKNQRYIKLSELNITTEEIDNIIYFN